MTSIILRRFRQASTLFSRSFSTPSAATAPGFDNEAWQIHSYGGLEELQKCSVHTPTITKPDQVLVEVNAASVNPLDVAMTGGYGSAVLDVLRKAEKCSPKDTIEFPLTLGRDFAGTVSALGQGVEGLQVGDKVWGVLSPHLQGSHAKFVVAPSSCVMKKPSNLSMTEAASLVYTSMTAWSALQVTGGLAVLGAAGRKVLVLGGSGGVGISAVQMLQAWGSLVTSTCSTDAVPLLQTLGLISPVDYTQPDLHKKLSDIGKFDVILDCAGLGTDGGKEYYQHLSENPLAKYVTLKSPLLREMDSLGIVGGALASVASLIQANLQPGLLPRFAPVRWGFFMPLPPALHSITQLASRQQLRPILDSTFAFDDLPKAFAKQQAGHVRGKIVVNMQK